MFNVLFNLLCVFVRLLDQLCSIYASVARKRAICESVSKDCRILFKSWYFNWYIYSYCCTVNVVSLLAVVVTRCRLQILVVEYRKS